MKNNDQSVYQFLQDFDDPNLNHEDWIQKLQEAVIDYNKVHDEQHDPKETVESYINRVI
jgi:hypothetical protein